MPLVRTGYRDVNNFYTDILCYLSTEVYFYIRIFILLTLIMIITLNSKM